MDHDPADVNWSDLAEHLSAAAHDDAAWYADVARTLVGSKDRLAVDLGCGGGGMTATLADAMPAEGVVVGVDGNDDLLATARELVGRNALETGRVQLIRLDLDPSMSTLAEVAGAADIIWASGVVHHLGDQQAAVDALAARLAPEGRLALAEGGLSPRHLPWDLGVGEPGLEMRLIAADDRWFMRMRAALPGSVRMPYGWTEALRRAGLTDVTTSSTTIERPAPLAEHRLERTINSYRHRVDHASELSMLDNDDLAAWQELLDPESSSWLGRRRDVFDLDTRSVHVGVKAPA